MWIGNALFGAALLNAASLADILFSNHDYISANGTFPGIKPEHWIDLDLQKSLSCQPPQRVAACLTVHLISPANQFLKTRQPNAPKLSRPSKRATHKLYHSQ
jgi:hypothetical protein